jgi:uncharacterized membrane protein YfcA
MDYSSLVIAGGIALYGAYEYHRRDLAHAKTMAELSLGNTPAEERPQASRAKITTTSLVALLMSAAAVGSVALGNRLNNYGTPLYIMGAIAVSIAAFLVAMIVRDSKHLSSTTR